MKHLWIVLVVLVGLFGCSPKVEPEVVVKDEVKPVIQSVQNDGINFTITATDNVGVERYLVTKSSMKPEKNDEGWRPGNVFPIERNGRFYFWAKDKEGNISDANVNAFHLLVTAKPYEMKTTLLTLGLLS